MKIRQGFVSNSSSSSFVAIATEININEITKDMLSSIVTFGKELSDGVDFINIGDELTLKFFKIFKTYSNEYVGDLNFKFYKILKSSYDDNIEFSKNDLPDDVECIVLNEEVDQHSTSDLEQLIERYTDIDTVDIEKYINKLYRELKLERILK